MFEPEAGRVRVEMTKDHGGVFGAARFRQRERDGLEGLPGLLPVADLEQRVERVVAAGECVGSAEPGGRHGEATQGDGLGLQVARGVGDFGDSSVGGDRRGEVRRGRGEAGVALELMGVRRQSGGLHSGGHVAELLPQRRCCTWDPHSATHRSGRPVRTS